MGTNSYFNAVFPLRGLVRQMYLSVILMHFYSFYLFLYTSMIFQHLMNCGFSLGHRDFLYVKKKNNEEEKICFSQDGYIYLFILQVHKYVFFFLQFRTIHGSVCRRETFWLNWSIIKKRKNVSVKEYFLNNFFKLHFSLSLFSFKDGCKLQYLRKILFLCFCL